MVLLAASCGGDDPSEPPATAVASPTPSAPAFDEAAIEALFSAASPEAPGCAAAAGVDGRVGWAGGYGLANLTTREPITRDTVFDIGSTSKQFTATAILLLEQDGLVELDAPLGRYIGELPPWADDVTLRQMMHHQSGIPDYVVLLVESGTLIKERSTVEDALAVLRGVGELSFEPGTRFEYNNSNYFLFSQLVQAVTGKTLAEFVSERLFEPLGIEAVMDPVAEISGKAKSYYLEGDDWLIADSLWEQTGDGGIQTTASQLVTWSAEYWNPRIGGDKLLQARFEAAVEDPDLNVTYGAGIYSKEQPDGSRFVLHSGGWAGFSSELVMVPDERVAVAVTCNGAGVRDATELALEILEVIRTR